MNRDEARALVRCVPALGMEDVQMQFAIRHVLVNNLARRCEFRRQSADVIVGHRVGLGGLRENGSSGEGEERKEVLVHEVGVLTHAYAFTFHLAASDNPNVLQTHQPKTGDACSELSDVSLIIMPLQKWHGAICE